MTTRYLPHLLATCAVAVTLSALSCGTPATNPDAGGGRTGGGTAGGGSAGGAAGGTAGGAAGGTAGGSAGGTGGGGTGGGAGGGSVGGTGGGAGGGTGSATGGGAGGGAPSDCTPSTHSIVFDAGCPATFTNACGGNVDGKWCYTDYCISDQVLMAPVVAACPTVTWSDFTGTVNGSIAFDGGSVARDVHWTITGTVSFPAECNTSTCSSLETPLEAVGLTANCSNAGQGCSCVLADDDFDTGTGLVTFDGGTLSVGGPAGRSYDYCVQGNALQYVETGTRVYEPGTVSTLGR